MGVVGTHVGGSGKVTTENLTAENIKRGVTVNVKMGNKVVETATGEYSPLYMAITYTATGNTVNYSYSSNDGDRLAQFMKIKKAPGLYTLKATAIAPIRLTMFKNLGAGIGGVEFRGNTDLNPSIVAQGSQTVQMNPEDNFILYSKSDSNQVYVCLIEPI